MTGAKLCSAVAQEALGQAYAYEESNCAVGEHLADRLMLPMAVAGLGRFTASTKCLHADTNADVIARFLHADMQVERLEGRNTCFVKSTCQGG